MPTVYQERLNVPLRWWVQATMAVAALWLALISALPPWAGWAATGVAFVVIFGGLSRIGSTRIEITDGILHAGRARIPVGLLGDATALDRADTKRVMGVDADARAYLVTKPYLSESVRVDVHDPRDPTPYWLISTRHPADLARTLTGLSQAETLH